jgi:cytochrome c oxidase assembly factor CtaG
VTWWCSAQGLPWNWAWRPYPGVWLLVAAVAACYLWSNAKLDSAARATPRQRRFFLGGLVALWIGADWPVGTLGAGYLLSVHQLQFVLFTMVAPPLVLLGTSTAMWRQAVRSPRTRRVAQLVTRPVIALVTFNTLVVVTHLPEVVDGWMPTQLGTFALDLAWIVAGFALWWPVINPVPEMNGLSYPARFGYLLASLVLPAAPAAFLIFAKYPLYELYELAPPVGGIAAGDDQLVGGLVMKFGAAVAVFTAATVLFFRWHAADEPQGSVVLKESLPQPRQ